MRRGTTPTHEFILPEEITAELIDEIEIIYAQCETAKLIKKKDDCVIEKNVVTVKLTQEETFLFAPKIAVKVQVRVLVTSGEVMASDVMRVSCGECLAGDVLLCE